MFPPTVAAASRRRLELAMAAFVVASFVATRVALLVSAFDDNRNWEEPVFLFTAVDLQRVGLIHLFDYQDDLNHGGSLPLILLAVAGVDRQSSLPDAVTSVASHVLESFGTGRLLGAGAVVVLLAPALVVLLRPASRARVSGGAPAWAGRAAPPLLTFLSLVVVDPPVDLMDGYYYFRFFAALQIQLVLLGAAALGAWAVGWGRWIGAAGVAATAVAGAWCLVGLLGAGSSERADLKQEVEDGCLVYGIAEYERAGRPSEAIRRLERIAPRRCRERAFGGLGWGMAARYRDSDDVEELINSVRAIPDPDLRFAACGGVIFVLARPKPPMQPRSLPAPLRPLCSKAG